MKFVNVTYIIHVTPKVTSINNEIQLSLVSVHICKMYMSYAKIAHKMLNSTTQYIMLSIVL